MTEKLAYSVPDVIAAASVGRTSIYRAIKDGALVARKQGRRTVVLADDLKRWLAALKPISTASAPDGRPKNGKPRR